MRHHAHLQCVLLAMINPSRPRPSRAGLPAVGRTLSQRFSASVQDRQQVLHQHPGCCRTLPRRLRAGCRAALAQRTVPSQAVLSPLSCFRWSFDSASAVSAEVKVPVENPPSSRSSHCACVGGKHISIPRKNTLILSLHKWS